MKIHFSLDSFFFFLVLVFYLFIFPFCICVTVVLNLGDINIFIFTFFCIILFGNFCFFLFTNILIGEFYIIFSTRSSTAGECELCKKQKQKVEKLKWKIVFDSKFPFIYFSLTSFFFFCYFVEAGAWRDL